MNGTGNNVTLTGYNKNIILPVMTILKKSYLMVFNNIKIWLIYSYILAIPIFLLSTVLSQMNYSFLSLSFYIYEWNIDGLAEPTAEQLASYETAGNTAETAQGVLNTRASEYKELKEQLDLLYHDMTADKGDKHGEWYKHIKKVKDDNPKG